MIMQADTLILGRQLQAGSGDAPFQVNLARRILLPEVVSNSNRR